MIPMSAPRTTEFSSGAGCKGFRPRKAVMSAQSAATAGSASHEFSVPRHSRDQNNHQLESVAEQPTEITMIVHLLALINQILAQLLQRLELGSEAEKLDGLGGLV